VSLFYVTGVLIMIEIIRVGIFGIRLLSAVSSVFFLNSNIKKTASESAQNVFALYSQLVCVWQYDDACFRARHIFPIERTARVYGSGRIDG
jgi:hypothetical protein